MRAERLGTDTNSPDGFLLATAGPGFGAGSSSASYTVSGTITGLDQSGLVLRLNGADDLALASGTTSFSFSTSLASGSAFSVKVASRPAGRFCAVYNGSGTLSNSNSNVTDVQVVCHPTGLDPAFATNGISEIAAAAPYTILTRGFPALQPDGKILLAGDCLTGAISPPVGCVARFDSTGHLDVGFGGSGSGFAVLPYNDSQNPLLNSSFGHGLGIALQSDGKVVVVGSDNRYLTVVRLLATGVVDMSFATDGIVKTSDVEVQNTIPAVIIQSDGRILITGQDVAATKLFLMRYLADGSLDTSFNGTGPIPGVLRSSFFSLGYSAASGSAVRVQGDRRILVAGQLGDGANSYFAVMRFHSDGQLDTTFGGGDGIATLPGSSSAQAGGLALADDGKIIASGTHGSACTVARFTPSGMLDTTYNATGYRSFTSPAVLSCGSVVVHDDGRIMAGGAYQSMFFLLQTLADGSLDTSFGVDGWLMKDITTNTDELVGLIQQPDGAIIAAGFSNYDGMGNGKFAMMRLWP